MKLNYDKTQIANFIKKHRLENKIKKYMLVVTEPGTCMFIVDYIRVDTLDRAYELATSSVILRENTYSDALHVLRMITQE